MAFNKDTALSYIQRAHANDRMGHAYLLTGATGSGKRELALDVCRMVTHGHDADPLKNPDIHVAEPESKSRRITTDQVRELEQALRMKAGGSGRKVAIIFDADRLMAQAANAFLKTLEEPPANSLLILVTPYPEMLLETVLSRCIRVQLISPTRPELDPSELALLDALTEITSSGQSGVHPALVLAGRLAAILAAERESIQDENAADLKAEVSHYKQRTGSDKWLDGREDTFKAMGESRFIQKRTRLIEHIASWFADGLRQQFEDAQLDYPDHADATLSSVEGFSLAEISRRIERLQLLRDHLERTVNENLAIEVALLDVFATNPPPQISP